MARTGTETPELQVRQTPPPHLTIPLVPLGMSLGLSLIIAYAVCVALYVLFPDLILNHTVLVLFLPGFKLLDWPNFLLGLVESFGYGWAIALVFTPLFNFFSARMASGHGSG